MTFKYRVVVDRTALGYGFLSATVEVADGFELDRFIRQGLDLGLALTDFQITLETR